MLNNITSTSICRTHTQVHHHWCASSKWPARKGYFVHSESEHTPFWSGVSITLVEGERSREVARGREGRHSGGADVHLCVQLQESKSGRRDVHHCHQI